MNSCFEAFLAKTSRTWLKCSTSLRAMRVGTICLAILLPLRILFHSSNWEWRHVFASYSEVPGYPISNALGHVFRFFSEWEVAAYEKDCNVVPLEISADQLHSLSFPPTWPMTLRSAFGPENAPDILFRYLDDEIQNQFAGCAEEPPAILGEATPCLKKKFVEWRRVLEPNHTSHKPFIVFTRVLDRKQLVEEERLFENLSAVRGLASMHEKSSILPHVAVTVSGSQSAVPEYHAHPDWFVFLQVAGTKEWHMLPPAYIPRARAVWTGLSYMSLQSPDTSCVVATTQMPGDVLIVPSWWLHKTIVHRSPLSQGFWSHVSYGHHLMEKASIAGHLVALADKFFDGAYAFDKLAPNQAFLDALISKKDSNS
eukprot:TRINITY_DN1060_c0_g2_i1.p1 TRINITY_DN1060_c0_g2~~TRINITY_DN1060_c0_g2_i1.p1  ORF type:complete len:369 (-),score=56.78 TRINITY_DN1060_c0_g2_i1:310-1416(-)